MSFTVSGISMALIPHPQGPWLEGINPVTNLQWRRGVEPFMNEGARYGLLAPNRRQELGIRNFSHLKDLLDAVGRDKVSNDWGGRAVWREEEDMFFFEWRRLTSRPGFEEDGKPAVDVSWGEAKAWTLMKGGLYVLTDKQWEWSAQGGERSLEYATETGKLTGPDGRKLAHSSFKTDEIGTMDVNDHEYPDGPFGLRHKTGNVWEWTERNLQEDRPYGLRGGSWYNILPELLRVAFRLDGDPDCRVNFVGFRVIARAVQRRDL